jgi:hypothetical protein
MVFESFADNCGVFDHKQDVHSTQSLQVSTFGDLKSKKETPPSIQAISASPNRQREPKKDL